MSDTKNALFDRYRELQAYVGWCAVDAERIQAAASQLAPSFPELVEDFYDEIQRHPNAQRVIQGGDEQIARLKGTLQNWLAELVSGTYDEAYIQRRWQVGWRHVEIGLDQVFTNVALSRLRSGICRALEDSWQDNLTEFAATARSLNKLLDLDLAIIEDAYQEQLVPVILVSADNDPETIERADVDHVLCYLVKPIKQADLTAALALAVKQFEQI